MTGLRTHEPQPADPAATDPAATGPPEGGPAATGPDQAWQAHRTALNRIAAALGALPEAPATAPPGPDAVAGAAAACGLRARRVRLDEELTRRPRHPLLAERAGDGVPVVLLPGRRRWRAVPAGTGRAVPLDASAQAALDPFGWRFHRRLPYAAPEGWSLVRHCAAGAFGSLALALCAGLLATVLGFGVPLGAVRVMRAALSGEGDALLWTCLFLALAVGGSVLCAHVRDRAAVHFQGHVQSVMEPAVWDRLLSLDLPFFRRRSTARLLGHANGVTRFRQLLGDGALDVVLGAVFTSCALGLLLFLDPRLGLAGAGTALLLAVLVGWLGWFQQAHDRHVHDSVDDAQALLYPALTGIDEIHLYGCERAVFDRWWRVFSKQKAADTAGLRYAEVSSALLAASQPVLLAVLLSVAWWTGQGPAGFIAVGFAGAQLAVAVGTLHHALQTVFAVGPVHARLKAILRAAPETPPGSRLPGVLRGEIELRDVTFSHPGAQRPTLEGVDLHIRPGEFVAVVGPSGAGKSSLLRLLLGLDTPRSGQVRYDGQALAGLDREAVRAQLGYVPQDSKVLRGDLRSVILGGVVAASDADAWEAAEAAGIADDIRRLPMGLRTRVSDGDSGFSGGQLQRLLLARALAKRPRILLLDEATSALDNATQDEVSRRVARLGVTRVVVAHRLSTIRQADRVVVLDGGRVVECGTYGELARSGGALARLAAG
ncbi:Xenobiotic-transporting ATPase [Actinobacteria bacterium OV450]|nr:Xenobiotic-transporting ATPase [Actinobacteria bacterium OV450]